MSKSFNRAPKRDSYSFTTYSDDVYLNRIIDEAKPSTNFILIDDHDKSTGQRFVGVLVRSNILDIADEYPELTLGPLKLYEVLDIALNAGQQFVYVVGPTDNPTRILERLRHDIRRIKNVLEGKTVKVTVELF
jgi:hypothetical protein